MSDAFEVCYGGKMSLLFCPTKPDTRFLANKSRFFFLARAQASASNDASKAQRGSKKLLESRAFAKRDW
eukprot:scaffold62017_cov51-Attheya_sp.AAC.7